MRKFFVLTLAALLAVGAGTAHAGGYRHYGHGYGHGHDSDDGAYLVGGLLLGLAAGAALSDRDDYYYAPARHYDYRPAYPAYPAYGHRYRGDYRYGYGHRPRYGREVVVYREVRRPVYRDRHYYAPPRRHYGYGHRGW